MTRSRNLLAAFCFAVLLPNALCAGPLQRVPNTTLQMPSAPPTFGYTSTNIFPSLVFTNPICITAPPGETNRLFIVGKNGVIVVITNLAAPNMNIFMDLTPQVSSTTANSGTAGERGLIGMAFHPGYATNGYFYLVYMPTNTASSGRYFDRLARFSVMAGNPNRGDTNTQVIIYSQDDPDPNHNAGDIHFGADGYLYVSVGDEGKEYDGVNCAQIITNSLFSGILRLDVDKRPGNLTPNSPGAASGLTISTNYLIPADNPFVGITSFNGIPVSPSQVRTEFYAVGLRNPWRWSFDYFTNSFGTNVLYCGDVGQDHYEEVDVIGKGDNLGWAYWEGTNVATGGSTGLPHTTYITNQGTNVRFPIVQYGHGSATNQGNCVIGGFVYRGSRWPQLYGNYVYGDYVSGNIWTLVASNYTVSPASIPAQSGPSVPVITDSTARLTCFGVDPASGDILYAATKTTGFATAATIQRIVYNNVTNGAPIPPTLADTGAFTNLMSLTSPQDLLQSAAGIVPYDINVPFWSDNAIKSRWLSIPNTNLAIGFYPSGNWSFPTGTVWIKHFNLQLTNGDPSSEIRLETRLLVKNASGVYGVTYRWGGSQTNATLVSAGGLDESFVINDGGTLRTQIWHYPSQLECQACHTPEGGFGLGTRTEQLNKNYTYAGGTTNELLAWSDAGYFSSPMTNDVTALLALAHATNTSASLEFRSRSFLAANCSQCHQPGGSAQQAIWDARITTPTALAGLINGPLHNDLGDPSNHVITPLSPGHSTLLTRISTRGAGSVQMPPLDSNLVDSEATNLVTQWILSLSNQFWIGASPDSQFVAPGNNTSFNVTVLPTDDFTNTIALSVAGLPSGVNASFSPPSVTGSNVVTMNITTTGAAAMGTYTLTISGVGGSLTNTDVVTLLISSNAPPIPGTLIWTGGSGANTNWSTSLNWTNTTALTNNPPGPQNDVIFGNTATVASSATPNNVANQSFTIASLQFTNNNTTTPLYHVTQIADSSMVTISNTAAGNSLYVGTGTDSGANQVVASIFTGAGGTLAINNPNASINIRQGGAAGTHQATLNLSGIGFFNAIASRLLIAGDGGSLAGDLRLSGILTLAKTNIITLGGGSASAPAIDIGDHPSNGRGNPAITLLPSFLFLGQSNAIFADTITVGRQKAAPVSMLFNPAFIANNPVAVFRGISGPGSRVSTWSIGDNSPLASSNQASEGTNDFTGGAIDALISTMYVGRGELGSGNSAGNGTGTLTFNRGTLDVNTLEVGYQSQANSASAGVGTVNVNGTGTLIANNSLRLAFYQGGTGVSQGTLNVNSGTVIPNGSILNGGGTTLLTVTNGTLILTNTGSTVGSLATPIATVNLSSATFRVKIIGGQTATNIFATTLNVTGVNAIALDSVANVTTTTTFPLISYGTLNGSAANFSVSGVPSNLSASITNNTATKTISIVLTHAPANPTFSSALISGTNLILTGTNGVPSWNYYVLSSTNITLPLLNWSPATTGLFDGTGNFFFTNRMDPNQPQQFYLLQLP